ncbi:hypothetical protein [Oceanibium sediminis]|uniref:hypothetical protein n=1 Tax=Oceanibium sediminis TaxID=2026339 RepID=UPI000DD3F59F|nr:hypothetical protein [Oceanibium sediminis]
MKTLLLGLVMCLPAALPLSAEEFGRIDGTLNGEPRNWYTISLTQGGQSDASATFSTGGITSDLHLQGHPRAAFTTSDVLSIDLMYMGAVEPGKAPISVEVMYLPTGMTPPFWSSEEAPAPASVTFEELTLDGDIGRAVGSFSATLCKVESLTSGANTSQCQQIEGQFDTQVLIEE